MRKLRAVVVLVFGFLWDLLASSVAVARIVLAQRPATRPAILVMPLEVRKPWAVALVAYFTSLTPGSTCLHVAADPPRLYLHVLDAGDPAETLAKFRRVYERWVLELER